MLPSRNSGLGDGGKVAQMVDSQLMGVPKQFKIGIYLNADNAGEQNGPQRIHKFKTSFCTQMSVDYSTEDQAIFIAGKYPAQTKLDLTFKEDSLVMAEDVLSEVGA